MFSSWRKRRLAGKQAGKKRPEMEMELKIPSHFQCPISLDIMKDPVTLSSGITYDREYIEKWLRDGNYRCPVSNRILKTFDMVPNHSIRELIQAWCSQNTGSGIQRIPTPRVPVTEEEISAFAFEVKASSGRKDQNECLELVRRMKKIGMESERNRQCIARNRGAASALAAAFDVFAANSFEENVAILGEILSVTNWMFPHQLEVEAQKHFESSVSLRCLLWFLKDQDLFLSMKQDAILVLQKLLMSNLQLVQALAEIEQIHEILFKLIRHQICPTITKAALGLIFYLVSFSSNEKTESIFVEMGLVSLLLEIVIDHPERSTSERALAVLDGLCSCRQGREEAYSNALIIPVLVKKIWRVSQLATEFSVSAIWKLCKYEKNDGERSSSAVVEAVQAGAFQKLVLLLQVGCGDETKEKATELLKLFNPYREALECIESIDCKNIKRSF